MRYQIRITVLGSGTSSGVPVIGCDCAVCRSTNPKNKRWRSSCLFDVNGKTILVDTSTDLRNQALAFGIKRVDAVLITHTHADHVHGIDELRLFNMYQKQSIPVFGHPGAVDELIKKFGYIFRPSKSYPSLIPSLTATPVTGTFEFAGIKIDMIPCYHGAAGYTYNYRIGNIAWLTDTNGIPDESLQLLQGLEYLFLDSVRIKPHPTHFCLDESLKMAQTIGAKKTYLIHLAHDYDHDDFNKTLPEGVELAWDGLRVSI